MYLVVLVVDDPENCSDLLVAWEDAGVPGATILESTGLARALKSGPMDDIPLLPSYFDLMKKKEARHRTVFSVVRDKETVERLAKVSQDLIGDFSEEFTGFMFVVPVVEVYGLRMPPGSDQ